LVPNMKGLERALECGVKRIALFTAASDAFTQKNINMTVDQSLDVFAEVSSAFRARVPDGFVRGYVSTAFECPYAGRIQPSATARVAKILIDDIGVDEISLADTIGVVVPKEVEVLHEHVAMYVPQSKIAWHFHDTRGTAIANVAKAVELDYSIFDSSAGGLGGCPYAPGAGGNLAAEDLVYFLERSGFETGVDLVKLSRASLPVLEALGRHPSAKAQLAALAG
ncbi:MAG: hydroxymethylglutaryl-CoA lyase, partial [Fimbriimonadales bacterium]